jgi:hypothetical protein
MMKPCYPDLAEKDLRDAPWDLVRALEKALLNEGFLPRQVRRSMTGSPGAAKLNGSQPSSTSTTTYDTIPPTGSKTQFEKVLSLLHNLGC